MNRFFKATKFEGICYMAINIPQPCLRRMFLPSLFLGTLACVDNIRTLEFDIPECVLVHLRRLIFVRQEGRLPLPCHVWDL